MFERFTEPARGIMAEARHVAGQHGEDHVGSIHILLAIAVAKGTVAHDVLRTLDVDLGLVRRDLTKLLPPRIDDPTMAELPYSPRALRVLELAAEASERLGHEYIGSEHLLLGILAEAEGPAPQTLRRYGLTLREVREEIVDVLGALRPAVSALLLGLDGDLGDLIRETLREQRIAVASEPPCDLVITVAPERDPADMYRVGFARGMGLPVILLVAPGSEPHPALESAVVVELGDGLEERLVLELSSLDNS